MKPLPPLAYSAVPDADGYYWIYNAGTRESLKGFIPRSDSDMQTLETLIELLNQKPLTTPHLATPAWSLLLGMWFHGWPHTSPTLPRSARYST